MKTPHAMEHEMKIRSHTPEQHFLSYPSALGIYVIFPIFLPVGPFFLEQINPAAKPLALGTGGLRFRVPRQKH